MFLFAYLPPCAHSGHVCLQGGQKVKNHVTKRSSADCSLRAEALTAGPAVRLHPSDASDSLYGSRPKATAHKGWYKTRFSHCSPVILPLLIPEGGALVFPPSFSPHGGITGSEGKGSASCQLLLKGASAQQNLTVTEANFSFMQWTRDILNSVLGLYGEGNLPCDWFLLRKISLMHLICIHSWM